MEEPRIPNSARQSIHLIVGVTLSGALTGLTLDDELIPGAQN